MDVRQHISYEFDICKSIKTGIILRLFEFRKTYMTFTRKGGRIISKSLSNTKRLICENVFANKFKQSIQLLFYFHLCKVIRRL